MSYKIETSSLFDKEFKTLCKKYPSIKKDLQLLQQSLLKSPIQGNSLGNDCYKIRMAISSKDRGKSGGARVITCIKIIKQKIFLLSIYDKGERSDIEKTNLNNVLKSLGLK